MTIISSSRFFCRQVSYCKHSIREQEVGTVVVAVVAHVVVVAVTAGVAAVATGVVAHQLNEH
jgi:hypothetical protein